MATATRIETLFVVVVTTEFVFVLFFWSEGVRDGQDTNLADTPLCTCHVDLYQE